MPRSMFPEISTEETERSKNRKGSKDQEGEHIKNYGQPCRSESQKDLYARARGRLQTREDPFVSASRIIHARSDFFIGKDEAYIMNRKKNEKAVLRKEGHVCVLDLFVKVPSGAAAPIKCKPVEVDAINQVADGREQRKRVTFVCSKPTF